MSPIDDLTPEEAEVRAIWDAISADLPLSDTDEQGEIASTIRSLMSLDMAPALESTRQHAIWQSIQFEISQPAMTNTVFSQNGHHQTVTAPIQTTDELVEGVAENNRRNKAARVFRGLAIGVMSGAIAGGVAGGLGTRLAMRVAGSLANGTARQAETANGNFVGEMSVGGTIFLVFFAMFVGMAGGILYAPFRSWIPGKNWQKGLYFGAALLFVFGFVIMDKGNPDYRTFGSPAINIGTFSGCYILFGLIVAPVNAWLDNRLPDWPRSKAVSWRNIAGHGLIVFFGAIGILATLLTLVAGAGISGIVIAFAIGGALAARLYESRFKGVTLSWRQTTPLIRYAMIAAPALAGFAFTIRSVAAILGVG